MTGIEFLQGLKQLSLSIRSLQRTEHQLQADLYAVKTPCYDKERVTGGQPMGTAEKIARVEEVKDALHTQRVALMELKARALKLIDLVEDEEYKAVLRERYINESSWKVVADVIGKSRLWVRKRVHPEAIKAFEKIYEKNNR